MSWRWLLWLIPVYLIGVVVFAPARAVLWFIPEQSGFSLSAVSGTLWNGEASISAAASPQVTVNLQNIQWQLKPLALVSGKALLDFTIPQSNTIAGQGTASVGLNGSVNLQGEFSGNLQEAIQAYRLPVPVTLDGRWALQLDNYALTDLASGQWCNQLQATAKSRGTAVRFNNRWSELGEFETALSCSAENEIVAKMEPNNRLGLSFTTTVGGNQQAPQVRIQGALKPGLQTPREVSEMLVFLGRPDNTGAYRFNFTL
ncbi:type II secretion system protein N [Pseudidiomarina sp. CB1]|uniref:type II secretion system protein N n=1 Tax=Pseudidiomarina sp. CB1 TaxID=2972484 RepID=UPI0021625BED|nr:type II secretion system protein N [Pseudidiomarina sp. CB1]